ncbi:Imm32 family immunity protein [Hymenobacter metallicola]|uniref:Uncharacterized protein n=1 Tax=Hymenobacter metallicola TaxID=2563114 RepID=A0A4Z0PTE4_9BACT|nr:hypothetical protein [Hymenobacter metallicola]TGE20988.1 hypothetical protein E5K02_24810 [Hymenobacter metallicola]
MNNSVQGNGRSSEKRLCIRYPDMCEIAINTSVCQGEYEIDISGTSAEFADVTKQLKALSRGVFPLKHQPNTYHPVAMRQVVIEPVGHSNGVVTAQIEGAEFTLSGDAEAFRKLSAFLTSLSNLSAGEHWHLDWFANDDLLAPATAHMAFVFSIEG